jgi:hypothetical protein
MCHTTNPPLVRQNVSLLDDVYHILQNLFRFFCGLRIRTMEINHRMQWAHHLPVDIRYTIPVHKSRLHLMKTKAYWCQKIFCMCQHTKQFLPQHAVGPQFLPVLQCCWVLSFHQGTFYLRTQLDPSTWQSSCWGCFHNHQRHENMALPVEELIRSWLYIKNKLKK